VVEVVSVVSVLVKLVVLVELPVSDEAATAVSVVLPVADEAAMLVDEAAFVDATIFQTRASFSKEERISGFFLDASDQLYPALNG
jgi:hypothetical protein